MMRRKGAKSHEVWWKTLIFLTVDDESPKSKLDPWCIQPAELKAPVEHTRLGKSSRANLVKASLKVLFREITVSKVNADLLLPTGHTHQGDKHHGMPCNLLHSKIKTEPKPPSLQPLLMCSLWPLKAQMYHAESPSSTNSSSEERRSHPFRVALNHTSKDLISTLCTLAGSALGHMLLLPPIHIPQKLLPLSSLLSSLLTPNQWQWLGKDI